MDVSRGSSTAVHYPKLKTPTLRDHRSISFANNSKFLLFFYSVVSGVLHGSRTTVPERPDVRGISEFPLGLFLNQQRASHGLLSSILLNRYSFPVAPFLNFRPYKLPRYFCFLALVNVLADLEQSYVPRLPLRFVSHPLAHF